MREYTITQQFFRGEPLTKTKTIDKRAKQTTHLKFESYVRRKNFSNVALAVKFITKNSSLSSCLALFEMDRTTIFFL